MEGKRGAKEKSSLGRSILWLHKLIEMSDEKSLDYNVPLAIKDFIFDFHQATRRALLPAEVQRLYEFDYREITDKFFASTPWPDVRVIASECSNDDVFLLFYRFDPLLSFSAFHLGS